MRARPDKAAVEEYVTAGAERIIFMLPAADRDTVLLILDDWTKLIQEHVGQKA